MSGNAVSELTLLFTGDASGALSALGLLDTKMASSAKSYIGSLGQMDSSLGKLVAAHPSAAAAVGVTAAAFIYVGIKATEAAASYDAQATTLSNSAQISKTAADSIGTAFLSTAGNSTFSAQTIIAAYTPVAGMLGNVEGHALSQSDAMKVMSASQELAEASGMSLGSATTDVSQIMKDYHLNTSQAGTASNDLYNLQRLTGNSSDALTQSFNRLQPVVAGTNISVDQSSGLMLEMTTAFGSGRKAISLVGTAIQDMTEPTSSAQKALAGVGIQLTDSNGKFIGLGPALDAFKGYMDSGASATQKNALMQSVFGKNSDDMKKIVEGGSGVLDANTKSISGNSDVSKAAGDNANTLQGKQKTLSAAFKDVEITVGQVLLPILSSLMSFIMKIIDPIASWIEHNKTLATIIGGVVLGIGAFILGILALSFAVAAFEAVSSPIILIILAIIAVIAAIIAIVVLLYKNWDTIWGAIKAAAMAVWNALQAAATAIFKGIQNTIQDVWNIIKTVSSTIWNAINLVIQTVWNALKLAATTIFNAIKDVITTVWSVTFTIAEAIWNAINLVIQTVWNALKLAATTIFNAIKDVITTVWSVTFTIAEAIWNAISLAVQVIWDALKLAATTIFTAIQNAIQAVWDTISTAARTMWDAISNNVIQPIWNGLKAATKVFTDIQNIIQGVWNNIQSAAKTMWDAIVSGIKTAWSAITSVIGTPINAVITVVNAFTGGAAKVLDIIGVHTLDGAQIPKVTFATGGVVPGGHGGGDTVPAMLTPGERVLSTSQVKRLGGHERINGILGASQVQYFANGGVVVSTGPGTDQNGMAGGSFHGSWKANADGQVYTDVPGASGIQTDAGTLTSYVNGTGTPLNQASNLSIPGAGVVKDVASDIGSVPGLVTSALVGLGEVFIKGALIAAANIALAPLKAAVGALPDNPLGAALGKGTANNILDGIYNFITQQDNEKGQDPVSTSVSGLPITPALEAAALKYAEATFAGLPYTWGDNDCSGIVQKSYAKQGVNLPRVSSTQYQASTPVTQAQAIPGDLAFYNPGESGAPAGLPGHVGFYAGNNQIFDAYNTSKPIGYDPLSLPGNTFMGIRRPGTGAGGGGTTPTGNVAAWIQQALTEEHWPTAWAGDINTIIQRESGGNPNAQNNTDINAQQGDPSKGLMQVIYPTFETWRDPALPDNQFDPVANIVAAVKYILNRYGSVAAVASRPGGYEVGAWDTGYQTHMAMIHPKEMIIPAGPAELIRSNGFGALGGSQGYVGSTGGQGGSSDIDYSKLAAAMQASSGVQIGSINVTQSDATPADIANEMNWHMRVARLAVQ